MSDTMAMERAAGQAGQTAAVVLQVLVMAAQAIREHQQREQAAAAAAAAAPAVGPQPAADAAAAQRPAADPVHDRYAELVKETAPMAVAEEIVSSSRWPQLAEELRTLENSGVNVETFLQDAAPVIAQIDADLRAGSLTPGVTASPAAAAPHDPWAPPLGQERPEREGPGLGKRVTELVKKIVEAVKNSVRKVLGRDEKSGLGDRGAELARLGVSPQENARMVVTAREALADETVLGQLVTSREWPGIAGQMRELREAGHEPREALAGVPTRIQQAARAGISLTPAEAAHGLLTEQARTPVPAPAIVAAHAPTTAPAATPAAAPSAARSTAAHAPAAAPAAARAAAATAQSTTATPGAAPGSGPQAAPAAPATSPATPTRTHGR
ncbi:hypothetical protein [Actinacidiphila sp. bgisy144]|uniref:hypothetical protein n=1 Tax=Actinacidiphila sp. bgisy144 TaxID=3413791 RepID=UPI003EC07A29